MLAPGSSRRRIARTLSAAYSSGLLSDDTFGARVDELLGAKVVDPRRLIGDLNLRCNRIGWALRLRAFLKGAAVGFRGPSQPAPPAALLALDWSGARSELTIGRHHSCDIRIKNSSVSRRHARLVFRDDKWIAQDLRSTNGTIVNGTRVGRCELRPGDELLLGDELLRID